MTTELSPEPAVRVQGLEKSYQKLEVLRGVDFDVAPGAAFSPCSARMGRARPRS
jgi:ABC-2 type transport system ATP-binding protein